VLLVMLSVEARAQDPVTLPGVKVVGTADKPGPRLLVGIVVDTMGNVIEGVEVTIPQLVKRQFTRPDGTFRFDSVAKGKYTMRAKKIGYAPQVREFMVDSAGGVAQFQLLPLITALPAMVSSAGEQGVSGTVMDMNNNSVAGANVRLLGTGEHSTTDGDGSFFIPIRGGRYIVGVEHAGYTAKLVGVTVPKDSGRHVDVWLMPSLGPGPRGSSWIVEDLRERQAWTLPQNKVVYTHEDLARMKIEWIYDAVAMAWTRFPRMGYGQYTRDCAAVLNGGPDFATLDELTIGDVETLEIFNSFSDVGSTTKMTQSKARSAKVKGPKFYSTPSSGSLLRDTQHWNMTRICPAVYVWTR
jgi:hypothetical protein